MDGLEESRAQHIQAQAFYDDFQSRTKRLREELKAAITNELSSTLAPSLLDRLATEIADLITSLQDASSVLPSHDQRSCAETIKNLSADLGSLQKTAQPRQKFSFKKKPATPSASTVPMTTPNPSQQTTSPHQTTTTTEPIPPSETTRPTPTPFFPNLNTPQIRRPSLSTTPTLTITHQTAEHITPIAPGNPSSKSAVLASLEDSIIDLTRFTSAAPLSTLTVRAVTSSLLLCGAVDGAVHLTGLVDCAVTVRARQFRMHESRNVRVYLEVASQPVIEDCEGVGFVGLPVCFGDGGSVVDGNGTGDIGREGGEGNDRGPLWSQVLDFKFLGTGQSPHWRLLGKEDTLGENVWRRVLDGKDGEREELLRLAGIRGV